MSDLNDRIAKRKGWTREWCHFEAEEDHAIWVNPQGYAAECPDFVGTVEGLAGMLRELNERAYPNTWAWTYEDKWPDEALPQCYAMTLIEPWGHDYTDFVSPVERPGDCVGDAYLSMKEAADAL